MAPKRARYYTYGDEEHHKEIRKFIEDSGVLLISRDFKKMPLSYAELDKILGHYHLGSFLNKMSKAYHKNGLDEKLPDRTELIEMIAEDNTLLRCPLIMTSRLLTVGGDKKKIAQMLQIGANGMAADEGVPKPIVEQRKGRQNGGGHSGHSGHSGGSGGRRPGRRREDSSSVGR